MTGSRTEEPQHLAGYWGSEAISSAKRYLKLITSNMTLIWNALWVKTINDVGAQAVCAGEDCASVPSILGGNSHDQTKMAGGNEARDDRPVDGSSPGTAMAPVPTSDITIESAVGNPYYYDMSPYGGAVVDSKLTPQFVEDFNKEYFVASEHGKIHIYHEAVDPASDRKKLTRFSFGEFKKKYSNRMLSTELMLMENQRGVPLSKHGSTTLPDASTKV